MKTKLIALAILGVVFGNLSAQVPQLLNYQGRVTVEGVNFDGSGLFKFALVNADGSETYWSNDGNSTAGSEPAAAVALTVTKGLYSVLLGDTTMTNMTAVPATVFANPDIRLRVWFDDGTNGSQLLDPDQRIAAVGYAMMAGAVPDGAITSAQIASGAVGSAQLANGAVTSTNIAAGAVGSAQLASGAVTSTQLAAGAVQSANIAAGAVGMVQIADFAVSASQLRLGMESGTAADGVFTVAPGTLTFTRSFAYPFAVAPAVSLLPAGWTLGPVSTASFSASIAFAPVTPDSAGAVGQFTSLAAVNGNPAISYYDFTNKDLKYVRAQDAAGTSWGTPMTLDETGIVGLHTSLAVVDDAPAISYYDQTAGTLKYIRATNPAGTAWGTPVVVDSAGNVGKYTSLVVVDGNPAISYQDVTNLNLKFVRATNSAGTAWGAPVILDSSVNVGEYTSLAIINGNPAVSYRDVLNKDLKYVRATDATGAAWARSLTLDSTGDVGEFTALAEVDGAPAISYYASTSGDLRYIRATNPEGTVWSAPVNVDTAGFVGRYTSLAVINGTPAISYFAVTNSDLKFVRAKNASGTAWGTPAILDSSGNAGLHTSLAVIDGKPAISYFEANGGDLRFMVVPDLDWTANDGTVAPLTAYQARSVPTGAIDSSMIADGAVSSVHIASGAVGSAQLAAATAQPGHVLVANSAGELMWRPLNEIVAMQDYQFQPQAFPENTAEIGIAATGVGTIFGEVIHGPGYIIDRVANAHPFNSEFDYPGLNQEMDFVFDYNGPAAGALQDWHLSGSPSSLTITKRDADGLTILYNWSLQNFRLAAINPSPTGNGNRYTLVSTTGPDSLLDVNRSGGDWQSDGARSGDYNAPEIEIPGILTGKYPKVTVDQGAKTITIEATYRTGGGLFLWAKNMAVGIPDLRSMSLIYRYWPGLYTNQGEIGRNNFYEVFPIRYQQVSGFSPGSLPREQVVLAYGFAERVDAPAGAPLFEPPAVETFPAEGGSQVSRNADRNRMHIEIEGVLSTNSGGGTLSDMPILIQGPGYAIKRDGPLNNRFSGNNRKFPFIFDLPNSSVHLPPILTWLGEHQGQLPMFYYARSMSILGYNNGQPPSGGGTEIYRFNQFEFTPYSITDLGDGYSRVVLHFWHPPGMLGGVEDGNDPQGSGWGYATAQIDSDLDRRVSISGVADFYPEVTDDPEARTLTLWHNHGEGGGVFAWTRMIAIQGTAVHGKKDVTVYAEGGVTPVKNYFGCFPIEWQLVDGVERAAKGRARAVISYDFAEDP